MPEDPSPTTSPGNYTDRATQTMKFVDVGIQAPAIIPTTPSDRPSKIAAPKVKPDQKGDKVGKTESSAVKLQNRAATRRAKIVAASDMAGRTANAQWAIDYVNRRAVPLPRPPAPQTLPPPPVAETLPSRQKALLTILNSPAATVAAPQSGAPVPAAQPSKTSDMPEVGSQPQRVGYPPPEKKRWDLTTTQERNGGQLRSLLSRRTERLEPRDPTKTTGTPDQPRPKSPRQDLIEKPRPPSRGRDS
jgi:hypothetical protein